MPEYKEISESVSVPKGTGMEGYLEALRTILKKPRVQEVVLKTNGRVTYKRFALHDEPDQEVKVDFASLMPYSIIRSNELQEIRIEPAYDGDYVNAAVILGVMFKAANDDGLNPILFAGGTASKFWNWYEVSTEVGIAKDSIHGLPYAPDPEIPNETLLLCAAYSRDARLVDVRKSYKISIPIVREP